MAGFSLNSSLIPKLRTLGIKYRYIGGVYDPMTIIVTCKGLDICRIDAITDPKINAFYRVYWFNIVKPFFSLTDSYTNSYDLCNAIVQAVKIIEKSCLGKKEDKMNNKIYKVTNIEHRCSPNRLDEITLTVIVNGSCCTSESTDDCIRIKKAIESIGDTKESNNHDWVSEFSNYLVRTFNKTSIKDVIFNNPVTIVFWADGTKTVVKAENEEFDPEKGLAMAIAKKALGNNYGYYDTFKKYVGRYEKKHKKGDK